MAQDCDRLLAQVVQISERRFQSPAHALPAILKMLGFRIRWSDQVPDDVYAYTLFDRREVVVARDLRGRLKFPGSVRGVLHACLAHELAQIRLRSWRPGKCRSPDKEVYAYSCALLVPQREVLGQPETRVLQGGLLQDQETMWKQVLRLAERYQVTGAFMALALQRYGVIRFHRKRREIRPCPVSLRRATRVA